MNDVTNASTGHELVAFRVAGQEFAIGITTVREIRGWTAETALPHAPPFVRGVINLRGAVLPIVDLASRLGLPPAEPSVRHVIMVVQVGRQVLGLLVDAVSDIQVADPDNIRSTPEVGDPMAREFVRGVLVVEDRMIILLELDGVLPDIAPDSLAA